MFVCDLSTPGVNRDFSWLFVGRQIERPMGQIVPDNAESHDAVQVTVMEFKGVFSRVLQDIL